MNEMVMFTKRHSSIERTLALESMFTVQMKPPDFKAKRDDKTNFKCFK